MEVDSQTRGKEKRGDDEERVKTISITDPRFMAILKLHMWNMKCNIAALYSICGEAFWFVKSHKIEIRKKVKDGCIHVITWLKGKNYEIKYSLYKILIYCRRVNWRLFTPQYTQRT